MKNSVRLNEAQVSDAEEIDRVLTAVGLPAISRGDRLEKMIVARHNDSILGCAGWEKYSKYGLLRSVCVDPHVQKTGIGKALVEHAYEART